MQRFEIPDPQALPEQLPPGRTEPMNTQELSPQIDFLYRAADNFTQSVQFADAKAGGVVLILSIGILDLFRNIRQFLDARDISAGWGWLATISSVIATIFAIMTVIQIARTLFPRRRPGLALAVLLRRRRRLPEPRKPTRTPSGAPPSASSSARWRDLLESRRDRRREVQAPPHRLRVRAAVRRLLGGGAARALARALSAAYGAGAKKLCPPVTKWCVLRGMSRTSTRPFWTNTSVPSQ